MSKTSKVFSACAAGALIGALVALEVAGLFWWAGLVVGALVGYLAYEPTAIVRAAPHAWRFAVRRSEAAIVVCVLIAVSVLMALSIIAISIFGFGIPNIALIDGSGAVMPFLEPVNPYLVAVLSVHIAWLSVSAFLALCLPVTRLADSERDRSNVLKVMKATFILNVYFRVLPRVAMRAIRGTPTALRAVFVELPCVIGRFVKHLFIAIHSDLRVLCAVDAALGAMAGYFAGSAIIGAIAGGLFGVLNYLVVTRRMLKITPQA